MTNVKAVISGRVERTTRCLPAQILHKRGWRRKIGILFQAADSRNAAATSDPLMFRCARNDTPEALSLRGAERRRNPGALEPATACVYSEFKKSAVTGFLEERGLVHHLRRLGPADMEQFHVQWGRSGEITFILKTERKVTR